MLQITQFPSLPLANFNSPEPGRSPGLFVRSPALQPIDLQEFNENSLMTHDVGEKRHVGLLVVIFTGSSHWPNGTTGIV